MDFMKLVKFQNIEYIHLFTLDETLIHKLYCTMSVNNWLQLYSENHKYAAYLAPYMGIIYPAIDLGTLMFNDNTQYLINFLETDSEFIDINIPSRLCNSDVVAALVKRSNLEILKVSIDTHLSLDERLFSKVECMELCGDFPRRSLLLMLNNFEYWSKLKYLTVHRLSMNMFSDVPFIKLEMNELVLSDVDVYLGIFEKFVNLLHF